MDIVELSRVLQASIAPCVLISGLGLLLLSMSNRLARPIDRIRALCKERAVATGKEEANINAQIKVLYRRCEHLRRAIALNILSMAGISGIILLLFWGQTMREMPDGGWGVSAVIESLFAFSITTMMISLICFALDVRLTLNSLHLEIEK